MSDTPKTDPQVNTVAAEAAFTSDDPLRSYLLSLKEGERVIETGVSGLQWRKGTVVIKPIPNLRHQDVCVRWDAAGSEAGTLTTSVTGGTRRLHEDGSWEIIPTVDGKQPTSAVELRQLKGALTQIRLQDEANQRITYERNEAQAHAKVLENQLAAAISNRDAHKTEIENLKKENLELSNRLDASREAGWVKVSDRPPVIDDADVEGNVLCCLQNGETSLQHVDTVGAAWAQCWWRPAALPVKLPRFIRWKRSLTESDLERFGRDPDLEEIWKSIVEEFRAIGVEIPP